MPPQVDAAAATAMVHAVYIVGLIQTGLMRKWFFPDGAPAEVGLIQTGLWPLPCFAKA